MTKRQIVYLFVMILLIGTYAAAHAWAGTQP
jgi:hypothetical protein